MRANNPLTTERIDPIVYPGQVAGHVHISLSQNIDDVDIIPEVSTNNFSPVMFEWITSLLRLGYRTPLEAPDLYKHQDDQSAAIIGNQILETWERQQKGADVFNAWRDFTWVEEESLVDCERWTHGEGEGVEREDGQKVA
ncbi:hypothetical protein PQX77_012338 [Marasmius sp. AFHP31]|nr:hypothetical protein PQX77_012338 [Marasmius sp. AFHP31]